MSKAKKSDLRRDTVTSDTIHIGIELELRACGEDSHDDDACREQRYENQVDHLHDLGDVGILREYMSLSREDANAVAPFFDEDAWIRDYMSNWEDDGCEGDCGYGSNPDNTRDDLESELRCITGNQSFKVVSDGSIHTDSGQIDAEVCWNYFASKETVKDNAKILKFLVDNGCNFDKSCGLHINLNNYLKIDAAQSLPTSALSFLYYFVAPSRSNSTYCNRFAISKSEKYSMIYEQGDRLEFRFFSPTLEATKLNHYVRLAHTVYKRLAGKNCKLPKKTAQYFMKKMTEVNKLPEQLAAAAIDCVNNLQSYSALATHYTEASNVEEQEIA